MRKFLGILILLPGLLLAQTSSASKKAPAGAKAAGPAPVVVTPDKIQWGPAPPAFQPGAQFALIAGDPSKSGPFIVRLKFPDGYKVMPHFHPTAENVTVLSGELHAGMGDTFDESKLTTLPAQSVAVMPAGMHHYVVAKGETVVQVHAMGPFKLTYVNPSDDLRKGQTAAPKKGGAAPKK
jgi:Domain of unknown function (DUF4437)